jgi:P4 family phage/plasmid primase-like protien
VTLRRNNGIYDSDIREDLIRATNKAGLEGVDVWSAVVSDDTGFCEEEMARRLIKVNDLAVVGDTWHQYEAGRGMWSPLPHGLAVEKLARRGLVAAGGSALSTARHLSATMALARSERVWRPEDTDAVPQGWIAVRNGILNVMEGSMVPHHPAWRIVSPVPWDYEPGNDCPAWMDWLEKRQPDQETRNQLQEIAGYCLVNDVNYHAFFFMYGDGGTGKSTFVEVLTELVGQENTVSVQLEELGNPFTRRSLVSKKLFLCKELTHDSFKHVGLVKAITSGDPVYVDVKHREGFSFRPKGRFLMESNVLASTPDSSGGFERRFIQINWDVKIDRAEMDFDFRARFTAEMSGILNWCLEGYRRLVARGRFVHTARSAEASQELLKHRQQVSTWLDSGWIVDNGPGGAGQMTVEEMLENYKEWCLSENVVPFYKEVPQLQREIMTRRPAWKERKVRVRQDGDRKWVINGVQAKGSDLWEEMA